MRTALDIMFLAIVVYIVVTFVLGYRSATGSVWQRILGATEGSATIAWAKFTMLVSSGADGLGWLADILNEPQVNNGIQAVMKPQYVAAFMVFVGVVTVVARRRTIYPE